MTAFLFESEGEMLLCIRSAHIEILGFLIGDAYQYSDIFLPGLKLSGESRS